MNITDDQIAPELRRTGRMIRRVLPYFKESTFRKCNKGLALIKGHGPKNLSYRQLRIPRTDHSDSDPEDLRICVYRPKKQEKPAPGILWIHGGGYGLGVPEQDVGFIRRFVEEYGCTVVSPDYCLAVNRPYPAALEDCYTALKWMQNHAEEYQIRPDQLMIGGDSAGGGLTAALAIYARDLKEVPIAFQMPIYPMLDDRMITDSSRDNDAPVWNTKSNEAGWKLYLGSYYGTEDVPAYAAPARESDYHGLPPAVTYVGSIEPFRDETIEYINNLKKAGVPACYRVYNGCFHGFDIVASSSPQAKSASNYLMKQFGYAVEHYFAE